jgi:hypothetical protein
VTTLTLAKAMIRLHRQWMTPLLALVLTVVPQAVDPFHMTNPIQNYRLDGQELRGIVVVGSTETATITDDRLRLRIISINDVYKLENLPHFKTLVDHFTTNRNKTMAIILSWKRMPPITP